MDAIFSGDAKTSLKIYNKIYQAGADVLMIFDELLKVTHFLTQIKISPDIKDDIHIPEFERSKGVEMAEKISMSSLGIVWQVLFKGYQELQSGFHLFQHGEMLIIRLIYLYEGPSPDDLVKKITKNIEEKEHKNESIKIKSSNNETPEAINNNETPEAINKVIEAENNGQVDNVAKLSNSIPVKTFRQFVDLFYQKKEGMLAYLFV